MCGGPVLWEKWPVLWEKWPVLWEKWIVLWEKWIVWKAGITRFQRLGQRGAS